MEKLMFKFLDQIRPNMFVLKTKFGNVPAYNRSGNFVVGDEKRKDIERLCRFFSIHDYDGKYIYEKWLGTKPIYVRIKNSTNDTVLVPESEVNNVSTTNYKVGN